MALNCDKVGTSYPPYVYEVSREKIHEYAIALGETDPRYLSTGDDCVAPPTFVFFTLTAAALVPIYGQMARSPFVLLLLETTAAGAETVATRIRERVEAAVLTTRENPVSTTVSMGVASYPEHGSDLEAVVERADQALSTIAGSEETTTGVIRLRRMAEENALKYPIIAINDTPTKHLFDNRFGTGQSALDGIIRATNVLIAGRTVVVSGFGDCGRGVASRARGLGADVVVTEVDEIRALEAVMEGYRVMPMADAARIGDIFCTVTGDRDVIRAEHIEAMKDGAIVCNAGHFDIEIDVAGLRKLAQSERVVRTNVEEFVLPNGNRIRLLAEGRLVNLGAAEGHPAAVMDMSFANQALCAEWMVKHARGLDRTVHTVPPEIDAEVALLKLRSMGIEIDELTAEQEEYLRSWEHGT